MKDDVYKYNEERWDALTRANALFTRPLLELTKETAQKAVDPDGFLGEISGKKVLCLAGGGGQQSALLLYLGQTSQSSTFRTNSLNATRKQPGTMA